MGLDHRIQRQRRVVIGLVVLALLVLAGVVGAARQRAGSWADAQDESTLVNFSHRKHLVDAGAECTDCHGGVAASRKASDNLNASMQTCYACHDESSTECAFCHKEAGPDYTPFAPAERQIVFSHELHLGQGLTCDRCHRGMAQIDYAGPEQMPAMAYCAECHNGEQAASNCELCHLNLTDLRPSSHTPEWLHRHQDFASGGTQADCTMCHGARAAGITDCQECHEGGVLARAREKPADHYAPYAPNAAKQGQPLVLERVHELDYVYKHSLDARGKEKDCQSCHEPATFCAECHRTEKTLAGQKPLWHGGADWGAIAGGVGTGGGRHASMARRDIESCAACHDVQGQDPICLACHMDRNLGRGNDPRTHEPGYMRSVHGPWHNDRQATCYACHTPSAFSTPGFCTYCHGPKEGD